MVKENVRKTLLLTKMKENVYSQATTSGLSTPLRLLLCIQVVSDSI